MRGCGAFAPGFPDENDPKEIRVNQMETGRRLFSDRPVIFRPNLFGLVAFPAY